MILVLAISRIRANSVRDCVSQTKLGNPTQQSKSSTCGSYGMLSRLFLLAIILVKLARFSVQLEKKLLSSPWRKCEREPFLESVISVVSQRV